ncbi:MAG: FAD-binding oxidoreductase [Chloroflexota bacterium]|nr:FAD-binding oxidoreductase [Chloroflexota bacterium]
MIELKPVTGRLIDDLRFVVGEKYVLIAEEEREAYSCDESPISKPHLPDLVIKPWNSEEVAKVLALANEARVPVTPRGGGTGLSGGTVPTLGGIVLSLERMNRIKEIDEENFVAVVEPGVMLKDLRQEAETRGFYYPVYPGEGTAHIGGNVATNAGGMQAVKYGVTRNFVMGLEAVLPTGEIIRTGGKLVKCSTAYDLTQLIVGSEGTLAVITEITLRLEIPPKSRQILYIPFPGPHQAIKAVPQILKLGVPLTGLEFMERDAIEIVEEYLEREVPYHEHEAFLLAILDGNSEEEVNNAAHCIADVCMANDAVEVYVPMGERATRELLEAREKLYHALKHSGPIEVVDVVVPRSRIADFVDRVKEIGERYRIPIIGVGHAGDGNVHLQPLGRGVPKDEWERKLPELLKEIYRVGASMGGTISGEHGLGSEKKAYLNLAVDREQIALMARLKQSFDPNGILNPGKVFDAE